MTELREPSPGKVASTPTPQACIFQNPQVLDCVLLLTASLLQHNSVPVCSMWLGFTLCGQHSAKSDVDHRLSPSITREVLLASSAATCTFMSFKNTFCRTLAPASRKCVPPLVRWSGPPLHSATSGARRSVAAQHVEKSMATLTPRFRDLQCQLQPLKQEGPELVRRYGVLRGRGASVEPRVRAQVRARRAAVRPCNMTSFLKWESETEEDQYCQP